METWQDFLESINRRLQELKDANCPDPYFRGHAESSWLLEPGLSRQRRLNPRFNENKEARLYWSFRMRGSHLIPPNASEWTTLYYMQHFGLPTRLLDWTTSFSTALFFALGKNAKSPCIWILNPYELNFCTRGSRTVSNMNVSFKMDYVSFLNLPEKPKGAIAADGDSSISRIHSQDGAFTIHGDLDTSLEVACPKAVSCHVLPPSAIREAKNFLELAGTNEFSIYPDLAGLARFINQKELGIF
jgi:hypothetical protein